jgi:hypothetical protein
MFRRSFPIFLISVTFLISAWGNVIAAAFCPRYSARDFSVKQTIQEDRSAKSESCHHEMAQMDMDMDGASMDIESDSSDESQITTNAPAADSPNPVLAAFALLDETCGHCWMHSQPSSGTGTAVAQARLSRSIETDLPRADFASATTPTFIIPIIPFEHGPPGDSLPRHVLINVFRI